MAEAVDVPEWAPGDRCMLCDRIDPRDDRHVYITVRLGEQLLQSLVVSMRMLHTIWHKGRITISGACFDFQEARMWESQVLPEAVLVEIAVKPHEEEASERP